MLHWFTALQRSSQQCQFMQIKLVITVEYVLNPELPTVLLARAYVLHQAFLVRPCREYLMQTVQVSTNLCILLSRSLYKDSWTYYITSDKATWACD